MKVALKGPSVIMCGCVGVCWCVGWSGEGAEGDDSGIRGMWRLGREGGLGGNGSGASAALGHATRVCAAGVGVV